MTKLTPDKTIKRETASFDRTDPLVIELHPKYLEIRPKGTRSGVTVDYGAIYDLGRRLQARRGAVEERKR